MPDVSLVSGFLRRGLIVLEKLVLRCVSLVDIFLPLGIQRPVPLLSGPASVRSRCQDAYEGRCNIDRDGAYERMNEPSVRPNICQACPCSESQASRQVRARPQVGTCRAILD